MNTRKAIILPYVTCQNEPSRPLFKVFNIPNDKKELKEMLSNIYLETFELEDEISISYKKKNDYGYGDITVTADGDCFLYITFIE